MNAKGSDCAALTIYGKRRMGFDVRCGGRRAF
jgi:hypothetical protein